MWSIVESNNEEWLHRGGQPFARLTPWPADADLIAATGEIALGEVRRITGTIFAYGAPDGPEFFTTMF